MTSPPTAPADGFEHLLEVPGGTVRLAFVGDAILRLRISARGQWRGEETFMLDAAAPTPLPAIAEPRHGGITLRRGATTLDADAAPPALRVGTGARADTVASAAEFVTISPGRIVLRLDYGPDERVYGGGQGVYPDLDLRGRERRMWHEVRSGLHACSNGIPLLLNSRGYGVFLNSSYPARFVVGEGRLAPPPPLAKHALLAPAPWGLGERSGEEDPARISIVVDHDEAELYLLLGTMNCQLAAYRALTGAATLPPRWALGFIQSRNRYRTQEELMAHMREFRRRDIPVDVAVIDWYWFKTFGDLDWDRAAWPAPEEMVRELTALGIRLMQAQHPYVDRGSIHWERFEADRCLVVYPPRTRELTSHDAIYDYTDPQARRLWWQLSSRLFDTGVRAWWIDQVQPEVHPPGSRHFLGSRERVHNIYALLMAKCLSDGQRSHARDRVFTLSFAGYSGMQRYGVVTWSGDVDPSWEVMREQVIVGQQMSMSGQPWWTTDGGGYVAYEFYTPELLVRWLQWGALSPVFRTHSKRPQNEPWIYGAQWLSLTRAAIALRYRMLPYLYSIAHHCHRTGVPPVRPMALAFEDDPVAATAQTQYMFGPSLLVAPVVEEGARACEVYLPAGNWTCWWTGRVLQGGRAHQVFAPLERIPLFACAGGIVAEGREGPNADAVFAGPIAFHVFPGACGAFQYVEDDGWSIGYESGDATTWTIEYDDAAFAVRIARVGALRNATHSPPCFELVLHGQARAPAIRVIGDGVARTPASSIHHPRSQCVRVLLNEVAAFDRWEVRFTASSDDDLVAPAEPAVTPWLDVSRPDMASALVDAFLPRSDAGPHGGSVRLVPPEGWQSIGEPVPIATGDDAIRALRWTLTAVGPAFLGASRARVQATGLAPMSADLTSACLGQWQVLGRLPVGDADRFDALLAPAGQPDLAETFPGADAAPIGWRRNSVLDCTGYVNLVGFLENAYGPIPSGDYKVMKRLAYCVTWVYSDAARTAELEFEGEDRFTVWVDAEPVLTTQAPVYAPGLRFSARLREGWNRVLVKAEQDGGREWGGRRWGFYLRPADTPAMQGVELRCTANDPFRRR